MSQLAPPTPLSVLSVLSRARLADLGRELAVGLPASATREQQAERLARTAALDLRTLARLLTRDELKQGRDIMNRFIETGCVNGKRIEFRTIEVKPYDMCERRWQCVEN